MPMFSAVIYGLAFLTLVGMFIYDPEGTACRLKRMFTFDGRLHMPARKPKKKERLLFDWEVRAIERECGIGLDEPGYQPSPEIVAILNEDPVYAGSLREPYPLAIDEEAPRSWSGPIQFADPRTATRLNAQPNCRVET